MHSLSGVHFQLRGEHKAKVYGVGHPKDVREYSSEHWPPPDASIIGPIGVSVVMTTYSGDWEKLPGALAALAPDLHPGLDIEASIAVNDANVDTVRELIDDSGLAHPRLILDATGRNYGEAIGRNLAILNASQRWLAASDPDDRWRPGGLARLVAAAVAFRSDIAVGRNARFRDGEELEPSPSLKYLQGVHRARDLYRSIDWTSHPFPWHPMTFVAKTELVRGVGGWPAVPLGADLSLLLGMMTHDARSRVTVVPETVRDRHNWDGQVTSTAGEGALAKWVELARRVAEERADWWRSIGMIGLGEPHPVEAAIPPEGVGDALLDLAMQLPKSAGFRAAMGDAKTLSPTAHVLPPKGPRPVANIVITTREGLAPAAVPTEADQLAEALKHQPHVEQRKRTPGPTH